MAAYKHVENWDGPEESPVLWEAQAAFMDEEEADIVALLTGAGLGKTKVLVDKCIKNVRRQDNWHLGKANANADHLKYIYAAPHDKYLSERSIPAMVGACDAYEKLTGRRFRARTGRNRDGFFGGSTKKQEFRNGVDVLYFPLYDEHSSVSLDAAGVFVDEATMLKYANIWFRLQQRNRDPRALFHQTCIVGTPEADHFLRDALADADGHARPGVRIINGSSLQNPTLPIAWFEQIGQQASPAYIRAQVYGGWVVGLGGQRFSESFKDHMVVHMQGVQPGAAGIQFYLGWDPGFATGAVVVLYRHEALRQWWVVDEVVINNLTTEMVCDRLLARGYTSRNIAGIGIDIDATKMRSSAASPQGNDFNIIRKMLGVTPKYLHNQHAFNKNLRMRLDVIDKMLREGRILFNTPMRPKSTQALGCINSIRNFALKRIEGTDFFEDRPEPSTIKKWKHFIDALHYAFVHFDRGVYDATERMSRKKGRVPRG